MKMKKALMILPFILLVSCAAQQSYKVPPPGGLVVVAHKPIWLAGIRVENKEYTDAMPDVAESEHTRTVNAGYWLANGNGKISQLLYEFEISIKNPFDERVYTRSILSNPAAISSPFIYEHYLESTDKATKVRHGPLNNVKRGAEYHLIFEFYKDPTRTELLDRIDQKIIAPVDNSSGCVEVSAEYKKALFGNLPDPQGKIVPIDKVIIACKIKTTQ